MPIPAKYFSRSEFACKCGCGFDTIDAELLNILNEIRDKTGPLIINSASRCSKHNYTIGGSPKSQHLVSKAVDLNPVNMSPVDLYDFLNSKYPDKYGIGLYQGFVHFDVREEKVRW